MHADDRPLFVSRKVFMRRLATRLLASAVAMTALNALSPKAGPERSTLAVSRPDGPALFPDRRIAAGPVAPRAAEGRTSRLRRLDPARGEERIALAWSAVRPARAPAAVAGFEGCLPQCESRDPLIAANRKAAPHPQPAEAMPVLVADGGKPARAAGRSGEGLVRGAYQGIRFLARAGGRSIGSGLQAVTSW